MSDQKQKQTQLQIIEQQLKQAPTLRNALQLPFVEQRFVQNFEAITGRKDGKNRFMEELFTLNDMALDNPKIAQADRMSAFIALVKVASTGLSLKGDGHLYIQPGANNTIKCVLGAHGKRQMLSQMPDVKMVYESQLVAKGDIFEHDMMNGVVIKHIRTEKSHEIKSVNDIMYSYCRIEYKDGRKVDVVVTQQDLLKSKSKSKMQGENSTWEQFAGQMSKKLPYHRAFKLYYKSPDKSVIIEDMDNESDEPTDTKDVSHKVVNDFMPDQPAAQEESQAVEAEVMKEKEDFM